MAKFGRFIAGEKEPYETYESDYINQAGNEYIQVMQDGGQTKADRIVVVVNLQKGESVRKIG